MKRTWTLTRFFTADLLRSFAGIVPLALAVAFGVIAFEYGMDQAQFVTVGGVGISSICLVTTLLLAGQANRASSYPLLARLHRRSELLVALALGGMAITLLLALLIAVANLLAGWLTLDFPSALWIAPTWLALWLLAASLALCLSTLVGRGGSHLVGYALLAGLLVANDQKAKLLARGVDWLVHAVSAVLWPVSNLLAQASANLHDGTYWLALALTLAYAALLFALAVQLFFDKDLLWPE